MMKEELKKFIDPEHPELLLFKNVAPGTYKHCEAVKQIVEDIVQVTNIDSSSVIVASMWHDIGKVFSPGMFIENIDGENPHDSLEPNISFSIISRHVSDSVLKLIQLGMPYDVVKIVSEHHGSSIVKSIYDKAVSRTNGQTVEDNYRYRSTPPTSVESCILMIADVMEAMCRSIHNNKDKDLDVGKTVERKLNSLIGDGQLDILRIGELSSIKSVLVSSLKNTYHKRVEYEEEDN
jgi:putative nucleotidyltransferase with HDIG domain